MYSHNSYRSNQKQCSLHASLDYFDYFESKPKIQSRLRAAILLCSSNSQIQSLQHISVQVNGVLNTTAHANKVIKDTGSLTLVPGNTSVGHCSRNLTQTLNTSQTLGEGEDLSVLAEKVRGLLAALDAEAEHATAHTIA